MLDNSARLSAAHNSFEIGVSDVNDAYVNACGSYNWGDSTYTQSGIYTHLFTSSDGLDSLVTLHLTIYPLPVATIAGDNYICSDSAITLTAAPATTYLWSTGATTQSISVVSAGLYTLTVTNNYHCAAIASHAVYTYAMDTITLINPVAVCAGDTQAVTIGYDSTMTVVLAGKETSMSVSDTIFLPDGIPCNNSCSYQSPVVFTAFEEGAVVSSPDDILYVKLNMEHSYLGDLYINITCPNGQKADILKYGGIGTSDCLDSIPASSKTWSTADTNVTTGTWLGEAYDVGEDLTVPPCDSSAENNQPGVGWNYCWSDNTTAGYIYASGQGGFIYRAGNAHWVNGYLTIDSSDLAAGTQFYHPDDSFSNLIGCPLNGPWIIEVMDGWNADNGYVFEWELALDPSLLPAISAPVNHMNADGPWITAITDSAFYVAPPTTLTNDTVVSYQLSLYSNVGCAYDTVVYVEINAPTSYTLPVTVFENNLPFELNGYTYDSAGVYVQHLTNENGCDSMLTVELTVLNNIGNVVDSVICEDRLPFVWNGIIFQTAGTDSVTLTAASGVDSIVIMNLITQTPPTLTHISDTVIYNCTSANLWAAGGDLVVWTDASGSLLPGGSTVTVSPSQTTTYYVYAYLLGQDMTLYGYDLSACYVVDSIVVTVVEAPATVLVESACDEYEWFGETLTQTGVYTHMLTNVGGCDSLLELHLWIEETPQLTIQQSENVICPGDSVTLQMVVLNDSSYPHYSRPLVAVGDILCTDSTTIHPEDWPVEGKVARGIVFYVDSTGGHGWAVHLNDESVGTKWCVTASAYNVPNLTDFSDISVAMLDYDGHLNTQKIRNAGTEYRYPAAYVVDFNDGWYIPALGQLNLLFALSPFINNSLQIVGGYPFAMNANIRYWSSTERSTSDVYIMGSDIGFWYGVKNIYNQLRSVCNF